MFVQDLGNTSAAEGKFWTSVSCGPQIRALTPVAGEMLLTEKMNATNAALVRDHGGNPGFHLVDERVPRQTLEFAVIFKRTCLVFPCR
jgi:hypothetical protein